VRRGLGVGAFALVVCGAGAARAELPAKPNVISHKPFALTSSGITVQYERALARRWSVLGGLGARRAAQLDFSSHTETFVSEGRYWLSGRDWLTGFEGIAGPYLGVAFDAGRTSVTNVHSDRWLGAIWTLQESFRFGDRFVFWDLQEVSLALSFDVIHEFDEKGRLAPNTRMTVGADFTVGWVF
jgi:hypothetical protein